MEKYDVFISYSSRDQKIVEAMCAYLEQHKVRCFVSYRDIPKGVVWAKAIVEALDASRMMVVVFSENFNLSDQVDREIELASEDKKPILTFRISDTMFKGAKKYYLKNINWIDAFPDPENLFDSLLDNVRRLTGISPESGSDKAEHSLQKGSLCPCGSGKLFTDCHGKPAGNVADGEDDKDFVMKARGFEYPMVFVEGGTFDMGYDGFDAWGNHGPVHRVTLRSYHICKYAVTQDLWEAVMGSNPSFYKGPRRPVEGVSWYDCQKFIEKLNELTGKNFRLPTEAEWEFAARGGNKSRGYRYSGSNDIGEVAWYCKNSGHETHDVGIKKPNELGIYDMIGNVWEWCSDYFDNYSSSSQTDPTGPSSGSHRVLRGGSCFGIYEDFVFMRGSASPDEPHPDGVMGFRLCL